jgi:carbamoyltransferase
LWEKAARSFLPKNFFFQEFVTDLLKVDIPVISTRHHLSHAASAFFPSPFDAAAILTVDGVGEWATTSISLGQENTITTLKQIHFPHSLGLLYSAFTYYCGFRVNSGEYKLMGLAPYGEARYADKIRDNLIDLKEDGSFQLNLDYFGFLYSDTMTSPNFDQLFGGSPRKPESRITRREIDLAASIQIVTEQAMLGLVRHAHSITEKQNLCLAGGVALNCVANGRLLREGPFQEIWIQPAAGDAGGALGAALAASHMRFGVPRPLPDGDEDSQQGSYLGPAFSNAEIAAFLDRHEYPHEVIEDDIRRAERIAQHIDDGDIVGFFCGRMEFGPRSLGARSILGDPRNPETQTRMNLKIKFRESFRPFAPSILESRTTDYFDLQSPSPYMLLVAPVRVDKQIEFDKTGFDAGDDDLLTLVRQSRSDIPAVTHVDYSARVQTVSGRHHSEFFRLLSAFEKRTGCPVLVNTSFNVRGEPIVCSPDDAYRCFMRTEMDVLVLGHRLLLKAEQPSTPVEHSQRHNYELD